MKVVPLHLPLVSLLMAFAAAAGGCTTVNTVENADKQAQVMPVRDARIITDHSLNGIAKVVAIRQGAAASDLMRVDVDVLNNSVFQGRFNYKFEWFDEAGLLVDSPGNHWLPQIIEAKETITLIGVAPNSRAKDFKLKLIDSRS